MEPNKSLASGPIVGTKKPKDRVTIMLACNATGSHKLPAVFIHKFKNQKCIRNIDKKTLPVWYYWNNLSWIQRSMFQIEVNSQFVSGLRDLKWKSVENKLLY